MAIYVATYFYDQKLVSLKEEFRPNHRAFMRELEKKGIVLSTGRLESPAGMGSLTILKAKSAQEARQILIKDPYVEAGLVKEIEAKAWKPVVGAFSE